MNRWGEIAMNREGRDVVQYVFDFAQPSCEAVDMVSGNPVKPRVANSVVVEFVDLRTRAIREEAIRRVRAHGIFRVG